MILLGKEEKGNKESLSGKMDDSVLYVQLPDGYPVITGQYYDNLTFVFAINWKFNPWFFVCLNFGVNNHKFVKDNQCLHSE